MDFTRALMYPFDDPDWVSKLGIGVGVTILYFIPLVNIVAILLFLGWSYEISKRVKNNDPMPLPAWSDFGGILGRGVNIGIPLIVYQLPTFIFMCLAGLLIVLPAMGGNDQNSVAALG